jgi:hypothetical protein
MVTHSNTTDLFTFFASFTTETTMKNLTEKPTIVTDYGKFALFFDTLNDAYKNYYNPSDNFAAMK